MKLSILFSSKLIVVHDRVCQGWQNPIRVVRARNPKTFAFAVGLLCVALRTVGRLSALDTRKGQRLSGSLAKLTWLFFYSFFFLLVAPGGRAFGGLPRMEHFYQRMRLFRKWQWPQNGFALWWPGGKWEEMLSAQQKSYRSRWRSRKMLNLVLEIVNAWDMDTRNFMAFLEMMDDSW